MIRVGDTYYMSSTTMHLSPGLPIMKSKDLVNWQLIGYAYDTLADNDALTLQNGKNAYGAGSWASSLRYHDGTFYVTTFSSTTGKTHIYRTKDIEKGPWTENSFQSLAARPLAVLRRRRARLHALRRRQPPAGRVERGPFRTQARRLQPGRSSPTPAPWPGRTSACTRRARRCSRSTASITCSTSPGRGAACAP